MEIERTSGNSARATKVYPVPAERIESALKAVAARLPAWESSGERGGETHLVRKTRLLGFKDDVKATVSSEEDGGSKLTAESASRLGKVDLGQNPRNLEELFSAVDRELGF